MSPPRSPVRPRAVVVGASAGGLEALSPFVAALPEDLEATVLVVVHLQASTPSRLAEILSKVSALPVVRATSGSPLTPGQVVVAPPDHHLLVRAGRTVLSAGTKQNGYRPAVDALFRSAARWLGPRAVAVVLSGRLEDGAAGAAAVAAHGGTVLVQDPEQARYDSMPQRAQAAVPSALSLPVVEIAHRLPALLADMDGTAGTPDVGPGRPRRPYCPRCHGGGPQTRPADTSLWTAIASLEERASAHHLIAATDGPDRETQLEKAEDVTHLALALRQHLRPDRRAG